MAHPRRLVASALRPLARAQSQGGFSRSPFSRAAARTQTNFGFIIVPQQRAAVIERLGKFHAVLEPGFHLLIPVIDKVAHLVSLKEEMIIVPNQTAITKDNVLLQIDGTWRGSSAMRRSLPWRATVNRASLSTTIAARL